MKNNKAIWELLYCYDGLQYKPLKVFRTTVKRTGGTAALLYREKLLKTSKYQGKSKARVGTNYERRTRRSTL
jgi:hypothetical protein